MGKIENGKVILSPIGHIVNEEFNRSFIIRKELRCDCYMIMPDHIHMIVEISPSKELSFSRNAPCIDDPSFIEAPPRMEARPPRMEARPSRMEARPPRTDARPCVRTGRRPRSISSFIAGFKSSATKRVNQYLISIGEPLRKPFWLGRFYDRIIRNNRQLCATRRYILTNPCKVHGRAVNHSVR